MIRNPRVLLVEPDESLRSLLEEYLLSLGCRVTVVSRVLESIPAVQKTPCDLALLDFSFMEKDAAQTALGLKSDYPSIRIVLIGEVPQDSHLSKILYDVLPKPFGLSDIQEIVMRMRSADSLVDAPPAVKRIRLVRSDEL